MQKNIETVAGNIPRPADFRAWVQDALAILGVSALSVGRALGLGKNTLGDFLGKPGRSIQLDTAAKVYAYLRNHAALLKKPLPRLEVAANG